MILSHFSEKPIDELLTLQQQGESMKPTGLWLSVDGEDDWPTWCESEGYPGCGRYRYRVHLHDLDQVLVLKTPDDVRRFGDMRGIDRFGFIDWEQVARDVAGIIIAPYQWDCRLSLFWYYGWDCASGCIWDPSVIDRLELLT